MASASVCEALPLLSVSVLSLDFCSICLSSGIGQGAKGWQEHSHALLQVPTCSSRASSGRHGRDARPGPTPMSDGLQVGTSGRSSRKDVPFPWSLPRASAGILGLPRAQQSAIVTASCPHHHRITVSISIAGLPRNHTPTHEAENSTKQTASERRAPRRTCEEHVLRTSSSSGVSRHSWDESLPATLATLATPAASATKATLATQATLATLTTKTYGDPGDTWRPWRHWRFSHPELFAVFDRLRCLRPSSLSSLCATVSTWSGTNTVTQHESGTNTAVVPKP